ncbi:TRAP transporter substrate-binding protein [Microbulbifer sp. S227A]|uniref:TRAP transporter substrate-binding protein n=1 Tax=Microbulbifer sp. S227A TaxID=3415131 RepID=UPI003C7A4E2F
MKSALFALGAAMLTLAPVASDAREIEIQSLYPGGLVLLGEGGVKLAERVTQLSGGDLELTFRNPGELVPGTEIWDALSSGAIEASWYATGFAEGIVPSASLFTSFPFGPDIREYSAWWYQGGGRELWNEITEPYNIHSELCTVLAPEASGWFREEITGPEDLDGLKMRVFGLGAAVMQKLGVAAQSLPPADMVTALNLGTIDAAELSMPSSDLAYGMYEHAKHYYFPGWHQQNSFIMFMMNKDSWDGLEDNERLLIRTVCDALVAETVAQGEAIQMDALETLVNEHGVILHRWSDDMLDIYRAAWDEVVAERSAQSEEFARVWAHVSAFRENFTQWKELGFVE